MKCANTNSTCPGIFAVNDLKLFAQVVTLSTQDNANNYLVFYFFILKSGFKQTINLNKYQSKVSTHAQNQYFNYLIVSSFQGANITFVLSIGDNAVRTENIGYFLPKVDIKYYNMIDGWNVFDEPVKK